MKCASPVWVGAVLFAVSVYGVNAYAVDAAPASVDRGASAKPLPAGGGPNGGNLFKERCASCHEANLERVPTKEQLALRFPDQIVIALTSGLMQPYGAGAGMSVDEMDAVATFLTGRRPPREIPTQMNPPLCEPSGKRFSMSGPSWNGWSPDAQNLRYQQKPGLSVQDIPRLQVKWALTYIGGRYGQPTVVGGRVFTASSAGKIYSLDAKTGCMHWRFDAPSGVRTTLTVGKNKASPSGYAAYFGSYDRVVYAVDAATGNKLWEATVETHPRQVLTGTPVLYKDRIIVPVSSWEEFGTAGATNYQCCTARGSIAALDTKTGALLWRTYMLPPAQPIGKNRLGVQMFGPAGAAIWSAPTVDAKRKQVYVTTGDAYTDVDTDTTDSIIALDLNTGAIRWKRQITAGDVYIAGCPKERKPTSPPNCPEKPGPDADFGSSAFLIKGPNKKDVLVAGQKNASVHALNPDTGEVVWQSVLGKGSALGGIEWGMTTDTKLVFAANADIGGGKPGLFALDPIDGKTVWYVPSPKVACAWQAGGGSGGTMCINANSQAPSAVPGVVFSGTMDGHMRAYDAKTGAIIWDFDTAANTYATVNGYKEQAGGSLDATGPVVVDGMMFVMSGYNGVLGGVPDNVLLAFSVDGK